MADHELKVWPEYFASIESGEKVFEFRRDDRAPRFAVGDVLRLREFDGGRFGQHTYSGRECRRLVTYVARGSLIPEGFCVMSLAPLAPPAAGEGEPHDDGWLLREKQRLFNEGLVALAWFGGTHPDNTLRPIWRGEHLDRRTIEQRAVDIERYAVAELAKCGPPEWYLDRLCDAVVLATLTHVRRSMPELPKTSGESQAYIDGCDPWPYAAAPRERAEPSDTERLDWLEANGGRASLLCWNVPDDDGESEHWAPPMPPNNGWSIEVAREDEDGDETIARGVTARMAIDDAIRQEARTTRREVVETEPSHE